MSDKHYIAPIFIEKLEHKIPEVRERALSSIISKLDYGFTFENELLSYRELLAKLFNWFLLEPCSNEENVIALIKRILQLPKGKIILAHCEHAMKLEIDKIKSYIHPKFHEKLDDIFDTKTQETSEIDVVPSASHEHSSSRSSISDVQPPSSHEHSLSRSSISDVRPSSSHEHFLGHSSISDARQPSTHEHSLSGRRQPLTHDHSSSGSSISVGRQPSTHEHSLSGRRQPSTHDHSSSGSSISVGRQPSTHEHSLSGRRQPSTHDHSLSGSSISDVQCSSVSTGTATDLLVRKGPYLYIEPTLIQDLEHKLPEIRERSLYSIIARIECGFTFEDELPCYRKLLTNLFNLFITEAGRFEEDIIGLIRSILQSQAGKTLMAHYMPEIQQDLNRIEPCIDPKFHAELNDTLCSEASKMNIIICASQPSTGGTTASHATRRNTGSCATASTSGSERSIPQRTSVESQASLPQTRPQTSEQGSFKSDNNYTSTCSADLRRYILEWQPLIKSDGAMLKAVEQSLKDPEHVSERFNSCAFFTNVLLYDFPTEVFIQRPGIITIFHEFLSTPHSSRLTNTILQCLFEFTKALGIRIYQYHDICLQNSKTQELFNLSSYDCDSETSSDNGGLGHFELIQETNILKRKQLTIPEYCFRTINIILKCMVTKKESLTEHKPKLNQTGINHCLTVLDELITILCKTVGADLWKEELNSENLDIFKEISNSSSLLGDTIEYFHIESTSVKSNLTCRAIYLFLTCLSVKWLINLIPPSKTKLILPKNFKVCLCNRLLDVSLGRLYPKIHRSLLGFVESFSTGPEVNCLKKYEDVMKVCNGLTSSVKFIENSDSLVTGDKFKLACEALPSLEFHQNMDFIAGYIDLCSKKFFKFPSNHELNGMAIDTILFLLAHRLNKIRQETYRLCHKIVAKTIGFQINLSPDTIYGSQIAFLLSSAVLTEIAVFGLINVQVQKYAEEILLYILKCKMIVSDLTWSKCLQALIPSLPLIICYSANATTLGRTIVNFVDPDSARSLGISYIVMLKANVELLFCKDSTLRYEAYSRICWLLLAQEDAREMLPKFDTIYNEELSNAFNIEKTLDVNKMKRSVHLYQPSSLLKVLDVLKSEDVDPSIRRSALNQTSLMAEDYLLHDTFLELGGLDVMIEIMERALTTNDSRDTPDSVIPIVSTLRTMALYHSSVREYIGQKLHVIYLILRGAFLFINEDRMKEDATALVFLLIFKDYIIGSPLSMDLSIPKIVGETLLVPFICKRHMIDSKHTSEDLFSKIIEDQYSLTSVQVQWNAAIHGGFDNLINLKNVPSPVAANIQGHEILTLSNSDFMQIKESSLDFCIKKYIFTIQSATSHEAVLDSITKLTLYVHLGDTLTQLGEEKCIEVVRYPWKKSFIRYVDFLPSGDDDIKISESVIKFLIVLVPLFKDPEPCWISKFLKNPKNPLLNSLSVEYCAEENIKTLGQALLKLITLCVLRESDHLNSSASNIELTSDWGHVIRIIGQNLQSEDTQRFSNLAYLVALLSCLVNLTSKLGWSHCKPDNPPKEPIPQLILSLCDLLASFHSTRGASTGVSVMGISVSRNIILTLNHLLAEIFHFKVKKWERCFFEHDEIRRARKSFFSVWTSRDVILRAAAVQLISNLTTSSKATDEVLNDFERYKANIWELALRIIIDYGEAGVVKENAALILANLSIYISRKTRSGSMPSLFFIPSCDSRSRKDKIKITKFLEDYNFYDHVGLVLTPAYARDCGDHGERNVLTEDQDSIMQSVFSSVVSLNDEPQLTPLNLYTPGFMKAFCKFLFNMIDLAPKEICQMIHERGFVKLICGIICSPSKTVDDKKELIFNCSLLEMNTAVCTCLKRICLVNKASLVTLLHSRESLNALFSLLNSKNYETYLSPLLYLRNNLWSEIFNLITTLLDGFAEQKVTSKSIDALSMIADTITETGTGVFLGTLCESLGSIGTSHLQNSSLATLVALLRIECAIALNTGENSIPKTHSIESLLDTVRSHKTILISSLKENTELQERIDRAGNSKTYKKNLLEEAYFGEAGQLRSNQQQEGSEISIIDSSDDDASMTGAEFCKIILYLFDIVNIKLHLDNMGTKRYLVNAALTGLLCISQEAKKLAVQKGVMKTIVKELRDYHVKLSLESFDNLRKVQDRRRICPMLEKIGYFIGLATNFMLNAVDVKKLAASLDLADVTHKLWVWFSYQNAMNNVLKMLSVYTFQCPQACRTLLFTNPNVGSGPRRTLGTASLLHCIIAIILKQMDQINQTHDLHVLELAFDILQNCCDLIECRLRISQSNLFQAIMKLNPAVTKRKHPWSNVELLWIKFLKTYTYYPEGQTALMKDIDTLEVVIALTKSNNRQDALLILRNVSFYRSNKTKLLSSRAFLNLLQTKLANGTRDEKRMILSIMWTLAANCQKAKIIFKSAHLDVRLENTIKCTELVENSREAMEKEDLDMMYVVLSVLRDKDKIRKRKK
ncbi:unnamed protein product [Ceutorhynchus assimilis]|uniref:Rotatin N-terminal domain-containing protein n=1 Tax=Ceutorhynchus assimilis TaxID=467358 RepID=A0A9P0GQ28_9CUCU|nr:unnamed protein product [Ceutorhynchus assimilis]